MCVGEGSPEVLQDLRLTADTPSRTEAHMKTSVLFWSCLLLLAACAAHDPFAAPLRAVAKVVPASGSSVTGTVTFTQKPDGIEVYARIENLSPGKHGFHVHEIGDCSAHDGASAGGHYNPDGKPHGDRFAAERHVGDLGNLVADSSGLAELVFIDNLLALSGPHSIMGRSIMVHADPDDGTTQPTGNSGKRIGCGVITLLP